MAFTVNTSLKKNNNKVIYMGKANPQGENGWIKLKMTGQTQIRMEVTGTYMILWPQPCLIQTT